MRTPTIKSTIYAEREIKTLLASALTLEDTRTLIAWCNWHRESDFDGLDLQAILDLYTASSVWEGLDAWLSSENDEQVAAHEDLEAIQVRNNRRNKKESK